MTKPFDPFNQCTEYAKQIQELLAANAALELEVVRLRSVIADVIKAHGYAGGTPVEVMSAPFTPTVLPELIEKVEKMTIERCAGVCKTLDRKEKLHAAGYGPGYLTHTASDCEQIIRVLPIGQIKLEELL